MQTVAVTPLHEPLTETWRLLMRRSTLRRRWHLPAPLSVSAEVQKKKQNTPVRFCHTDQTWVPRSRLPPKQIASRPLFFSLSSSLQNLFKEWNESTNKIMKCQANVRLRGWCNTQKSGIYSTFFLSFFLFLRFSRCFGSFMEVDGVHFDHDLDETLLTKTWQAALL